MTCAIDIAGFFFSKTILITNCNKTSVYDSILIKIILFFFDDTIASNYYPSRFM